MNLAELEKELKQRAQQTEKERLAAVEQHTRELAEARDAKQAELDIQNARIKANQEKHEKAKRDAEAAELNAKQAEHASRIRLENAQNARDEQLRLQKEAAEQLERQLEQEKWLEEQHRKSLQPLVVASVVRSDGEYVEDTSGNAVIGTEGSTPDTPFMSEHMRRILRQVNKEN